jgi:hypothetical protein
LVRKEGEIVDDKMISATIAEVFEEIADALETGSYGKKVWLFTQLLMER